MKVLLHHRVLFRTTLKLILIFSFSIASYSQTFFGISANPTDNNSQTNASVSVIPPGGMQSGDLVVIYAHYRHTSTNTLAINDDGGQTWTSESQSNGTTQRTRIFWCTYNGNGWPTNPSVDGGGNSRPLSVIMYVYRPNNSSSTWGKHLGPTSANVTNTAVSITGLTTTETRTVTMGFWGSPAATTWGAVSGAGWVKPTFPASATQIRNTGGSGQSHTAAYNIRTTAGAVATTSQTQSSSQDTRTTIISWYEIPPPPAPANDEYVAPVNLTPGGGCSNIDGTMASATESAGIPAFNCTTSAFLFDVWYSFTATSSNHTITLSNFGSNYTRRQLAVYQTNTLGTLSPVTCSAISTGATSLNFTDYSPGTTYLIRVLYPSTTNTPITTNAGFRICVTNGANNPVQPVLSGKSYTNITRPSGGTIQTGDVLEFRQSINPGNWSVSNGAIFNVTYHDTIPAGLSYVPNSIRFQTNEGLEFESGITGTVNLTDASGDDEAVYSGGVLRVNVASLPRQGASNTSNRQFVYQGSPAVTPITYASAGGGKIHSKGRPSQFAQFVVIVVSYRVTVTAATGTTFTTSNGAFRYKTTTSSTDDVANPQTIINFPRYTVYVSEAGTSLCQGGAGTNVFPGGNFGSGTTRHDSTQLTIAPGYNWVPFSSSNPGDGFFSVVNNTSSNRLFTNKYAPFPSSGTGADTVRVFGVWDIIGDHTDAANPDSGNLAVPWGTNGGYMGVVNAAFGINTAIQKTITGLCTDTYYEFSAWFKNICAGCSTDSAGRRMQDGALFKPYLTTKTLNDSAGVSPDLTYTIDGVDYYTTGPIIYDKKWVKKGFLFKTGPSQTTVNLTIRNNAAGGGGNDWAIDDIGLTTCFPSMTYSPSASPSVCESNVLTITDTVRYLYNNYVRYKWQRWSAATSGPWTDIAGTSGTGTPVWNGTQYEYVASYTIPNTLTLAANNGDRYRLVVASNTTNLGSSSCSYSDPTTINVNIITACGPPLKADLLSVNGRLIENNLARISWVTSKEDEPVRYIVEKSEDGNNFRSITTVDGYNNTTSERNYYNYTDPVAVTAKTYYRVVLINASGSKKYSQIIQLVTDEKSGIHFGTVVNPFGNELWYEISSTVSSIIKTELLDGYGRVIKRENQQISPGINALSINTVTLPNGTYILRAIINGNIIYRKVIKQN